MNTHYTRDMKILLAGGGTGGHIYPLLAVARELNAIKRDQQIDRMRIVMVSDQPLPEKLLNDEHVLFEKTKTGKFRRYASVQNILDIPRTFFGILHAIWHFMLDVPDVVFAKGGYASLPTLVAARVYRIPVMIHESDSVPGMVNRWASHFARRIAIAFPEAAEYFPKEKTALVGNPIRKSVIGGSNQEVTNTFALETDLPVILVLGGSQGAEKINSIILSTLLELLPSFQIIHQCGSKLYENVQMESRIVLENAELSLHKRYHPVPYLNESELRNVGHICTIVVSRAGSSIFEIAAWGKPAILIPLPSAAQDHQRENAYNYARTGAADVLEQQNLTPHIFLSRVQRIMENNDIKEQMRAAAKEFSKTNAARLIAEELVKLGTH